MNSKMLPSSARVAAMVGVVAGVTFIPTFAVAQPNAELLAHSAVISDSGQVDLQPNHTKQLASAVAAPLASPGQSSLKTVGYSWFKPIWFSDQMVYFCKYESSQNYDQGLSYGDGYHAVGYFQFDNRFDLGEFLKTCYEYNPTKYASLRVLRDRYNWNLKGATRSDSKFTQLGNDINYAWHSCYKADPTEFSGLQNAWAYNKYYAGNVGIRNSLKAMGFDIDSRPDCIKGLVWGMSNLFGPGGGATYVNKGLYYGANWFLHKAGINNSMSDAEVITRICDTVANNVAKRYPSQPQYWKGWESRYRSEKEVYLKFLSGSWNATGVTTSATTIMVGDTLTYSAQVSGNVSGLKYNYVWCRNNSWNPGQWDSTLNSTGSYTTSTKGTFVPREEGIYTLYVDVVDSSGKKVTVSTGNTIKVSPYWKVSEVTTSAAALSIPDSLTYGAKVSGATSGLKYNYVWSRNGSWNPGQWDSTLKATGTYTTAATSNFKPTQPGTYTLYVDVVDSNNLKRTVAKTLKVSSWELIGINAPERVAAGEAFDYSPQVQNAPSQLSYNYVWLAGTSWGQGTPWDSTVKRTGSLTSASSYRLTPTTPGTYTLFIDAKDATGKTMTVQKQIEVTPALPKDITFSKSSPCVGEKVSYQAVGASRLGSDYTYNYVWLDSNYWGTEKIWDSTVKQTGASTSATWGSFTPTHGGTWRVYVDVSYKGKLMGTLTKTVNVADWTVSDIWVSNANPKVGQTLTYKASPSYALAGCSYNYVWLAGTYWGQNTPWDSTVKRTGKTTTQTSGTLTPDTAGTYTLFVDVTDQFGTTRTVSRTIVVSN